MATFEINLSARPFKNSPIWSHWSPRPFTLDKRKYKTLFIVNVLKWIKQLRQNDKEKLLWNEEGIKTNRQSKNERKKERERNVQKEKGRIREKKSDEKGVRIFFNSIEVFYKCWICWTQTMCPVVKWEYSYSEGHEFESRCWILKGHFFTLICCKICIACMKRPKNKQKRGQGWSIFIKKRVPTLSQKIIQCVQTTLMVLV